MDDSCNASECISLRRVSKQLEDHMKRNTETHEKLWTAINELKTNDAVQDSKYDTILSQLNTVVQEVKLLQSAPGDNWKSLTKTVLTSVGSILAGFVLAKLGIF